MKFLITFLMLLFTGDVAISQTKYFTKTGKIFFYSASPMENIQAVNNKLMSVWNIENGQIEFAVLMKGFEFEKALMQEHFNENYVESDKFPKAFFKGIVENSKAISITFNNTISVKVNGNLTLHGITNPVTTTAIIIIKNGVISADCKFNILLADYKILIPSLVSDKINKKIEVSVNIPVYQLLVK